MTIIQKGANPANYRRGRSTKITGICIHLMAGTGPGTDAWFGNAAAHVSANYGIWKAGEVHQYVQDEDTAWAQGVPGYLLLKGYQGPHKPTWAGLRGTLDPNAYLLSIEHEGTTSDIWTPAMLQASAELVASKARQYGFPVDRLHVCGHHELWDLHCCPGPHCNLDALVEAAQAMRNLT